MTRNLAKWLRAVALGLALCACPLSIANDLDSLRQRAQAGDADAQYLLADRLHRGAGVARDDVQARSLVLKAARQGHLEAQRSLGLYYWRSYGGPQDKVEALKWVLVAERGGNKNAASVREGMLKSMSAEQVREAQARADAEPRLFKPPRLAPHDMDKTRAAAERGDPLAQSVLGGALLYGRGLAVDEAEGIKWLRRAASRGEASGLALLGTAHIDGKGVPRDRAEGVALITRAAEKSFAPAQVMLSLIYAEGELVDRDDNAALRWARAAAEQGDEDGQLLLAALQKKRAASRGAP